MQADARAIAETERWFLKRGLPHFIADYNASRDVLTRAVPALVLVFLAEVMTAPKKSFPLWLDAAAVAGGFGILLGAWALANALRHRAALARPDDIGPFEVLVFVLAPALVPLVFGKQVRQAVGIAGLNVVLLAGIYLATSYGLVPTVRWAAGRLVEQVESIVGLLVRALPLLTLFVTFLFLTTEVWQTAGVLYGPAYVLALALFVVVGVGFVVVRLPRELGQLAQFVSWDAVHDLVADTPAEPLCPRSADHTAAASRDLSRREWSNVGLVALFTQGLQIALVSAVIGLFFLVLGLLTVSEATTVTWVGHAHVLATRTLGDRPLVITEELLRVAGFLTAFSGLNFTVYLLTDATYRAEFRDEVVGEIRQAFAVRAAYLAARETESTGPAAPASSSISPT